MSHLQTHEFHSPMSQGLYKLQYVQVSFFYEVPKVEVNSAHVLPPSLADAHKLLATRWEISSCHDCY